MTYTVKILEEAQKDLKRIYAYIQSDFGGLVAAEKYKEIRDSILLLKNNPNLGTPIPQLIVYRMLQYRHMVVQKQNKVVYEIDEPDQTIYVHLICSTRQDYNTVLYNRLIRP